MTKRILLFWLLFCWAIPLPAGNKEDLEQVQRNQLELQQQFWNLEKELQDNNTKFQDTSKKLQTMGEDLRNNQAALNAKLETILNQIQALNERLDETNRRIKDISARPVAPGTTYPESGQPVIPPTQQPGSTPATPDAGAVQGSVGEQQIFQAARADYSRGNFEGALRGFQDLLDQYPSSPMADDAQYMIGESYYGMKEYVDAVTEYDNLIKKYSDSDNVPGAKLKKAFSLYSLGKKGQAVIELQQIVQRYPNAKEAQIARQRLAELGLD